MNNDVEDLESSEYSTEEDEASDSDQVDNSSNSSENSSEEESFEEVEEELQWISKDGKIVWNLTNSMTYQYVPVPTGLPPGPTTYAIARIQDPLSSFRLFLSDDMMKHIVEMTNLQGRRVIENWKDMDMQELLAYVGLLVLSGVYQSNGGSTLRLWSEKTGRAIFRATMSHKRFGQINSALRFADRLSRPRRREGKLAPILHVWKMWSEMLPKFFNPSQAICVDEQLIPFRGRCSFKQYMPKKPAKYGLKVWAAKHHTYLLCMYEAEVFL